MNFENAVVELESFWESDDGVFWKLRQGNFVENEVTEFVRWLERFTIEEDAPLPRRLVSLLWYVPLFMQWQSDRVRDAGGNVLAYSRAVTAVTNQLERILGVP